MAENKPRASTLPLIGMFGLAAVLLIAGIALVAGIGSNNGGARTGPRLAVNQDKLDFGRQPFDKQVHAVFQVSNTGDSPLTLDASTPIQVIQGC